MARGWESKAIEAQQEDASRHKTSEKSQMTREEASLEREIARVHLSLSRVLDQLLANRNSRHQAMLEQARADLEHQIESLKAKRSDHRAG